MQFTACTLFGMCLLATCAGKPDLAADRDPAAAATTESGGESTAESRGVPERQTQGLERVNGTACTGG